MLVVSLHSSKIMTSMCVCVGCLVGVYVVETPAKTPPRRGGALIAMEVKVTKIMVDFFQAPVASL